MAERKSRPKIVAADDTAAGGAKPMVRARRTKTAVSDGDAPKAAGRAAPKAAGKAAPKAAPKAAGVARTASPRASGAKARTKPAAEAGAETNNDRREQRASHSTSQSDADAPTPAPVPVRAPRRGGPAGRGGEGPPEKRGFGFRNEETRPRGGNRGPFRPATARDEGDRGPWRPTERSHRDAGRPFQPRDRPSDRGGDRPAGRGRPAGDRQWRPDADRGSSRPAFDRRPRPDQGSGERPFRPRFERPGPGRPAGDRPTGGRPVRDHAMGDRPMGDRPTRDRPVGDRGSWPTGNRPASRPPGRPAAGAWRPPVDRDNRPPSDRAGRFGEAPRRFDNRGAPGRESDRRPPPPGEGRPFRDGPPPRRAGAAPGRPAFGGDRGPRTFDRNRPAQGEWRPPPVRPAPEWTPAPSPDLLAADEELIAGRRPVEEAFVARRDAKRLLVVPQRREALERIVLHATNLRIPVVEVEGGTLTALAGFDGHQGVAVVVPPRRYATLDEVLARAIERSEPPFVLVLDSLEDPQNVGTLLRSAEAAGVHGVLFPTHRQAPLTPAAVKASAGAVEHLLLCPVDDLAGALADLHARGLRVAGAEADAPLTARQSDLRGPLAIVVGSEGQGLGPAVRRRCDLLMRIPMQGAIDSLNAAVAGSILLFEAVAQRDPDGSAKRRPAGAGAFERTAVAGGSPPTGAAAAPAAAAEQPGTTEPGDEPPSQPPADDAVAAAGDDPGTAGPVTDELLPDGPAADPTA